MSILFRRRPSRVTIGSHRLGAVLSVPLLIMAATLAFLEWHDPTGPTVAGGVKHHDWTLALVLLSIGIGLYVAARAIGWIIDGFAGGKK
jgi:hypothetical protein